MKDQDTIERHFVTFYSPGTFVAEETTRPIDSWDTAKAIEMADTVIERYSATPFAFQFSTRVREANDLDSRISERSNRYFLGGRIETLEEIEARNSPDDRILIGNMRSNGWNQVIVNDNSWRMTLPLQEQDTILDYTPPRKRGSQG